MNNIETARKRISSSTSTTKKSELGQFLTPAKTAKFMANMMSENGFKDCNLLDPGSGIGSLTAAFLERVLSKEMQFNLISVNNYEIDFSIIDNLYNLISNYKSMLDFNFLINSTDFIEDSVQKMQRNINQSYTHVIMNPPYKKILSSSKHRHLLRQVGVETVNLYSAFVSLALMMLKPNGQLVAIIPRSFCNGPYYRTFREYILSNSSIKKIHLFKSRNNAFKDDDVLQENIIILLEKNGKQAEIEITTSTDDTFSDKTTMFYPYNRIVLPDDQESFIHIPTTAGLDVLEESKNICNSIESLNIKVSTGPVVDFRMKDFLRDMPEVNTVPLLYPVHFKEEKISWPIQGSKKPNAIVRNNETEKWLYPNGFYCVVRRFSSKEEKKRIVASVIRPDDLNNHEVIGLENHLNVFHENKHGLPELLAYGLAAYLNTTAIDESFRRFNGHTQVNATDLKNLKYPSIENLIRLGERIQETDWSQKAIDDLLKEIL